MCGMSDGRMPCNMTLIVNRGGAVESSDVILNAMRDKRIISILTSCVLCALSLFQELVVSPDTELQVPSDLQN